VARLTRVYNELENTVRGMVKTINADKGIKSHINHKLWKMIKSIEMEEPKTAQIKKKLKNSNDILKSGQLLSSKKEKLNKLSDIKKPRNELMEMNNEMKKKN